MALSGFISFFNLKNLKISVEPPTDIFALTPASFKLRAQTKYFWGVFLIRIRIFNNETLIPYLNGEEVSTINLVFEKRGKHLLNEISISSYFPFYFFRRNMRLNCYYEFIVFPKPLKFDMSFLFSDNKTKTESDFSRGKAYEGELSGVRVYSEGDPLKYIHWKASAKTLSLKTKEFSPPLGNPVIINVDELSGSLEDKISKAAYSIMTLSKIGNPIGLKFGDEFFSPQTGKIHMRRLLYFLATYENE